MSTTRLVRVTIAAPGRRVELAVPDGSPLAEILPDLLGAGDHVADRGVLTSGWTLRRADGTVLEPDGTLAAHEVADGEVLSLLPTRTDWPEHETEDPPRPAADPTEIGPAQPRGVWGPRHTEWTGLAAGATTILLCLLGVTRSGWPGHGPAWWALGLAGLALAIGVALTRGLRDAVAGSVYATVALACAVTGGGLVWPQDSVLGAGLALLVASVTGALVGAGRVAVLVAGATVGLLTVVTAGLTAWTGQAAAVVAGAGLAVSPLIESWSKRLGRLAFPVPPMPRSAISAPVVRADDVHTGLVAGIAAVVLLCQLVLVRSGDTAALILVAMLTAGFMLRARLQHNVARRLALLAAAGCGAACLAADPLLTHRPGWLSLAGPVLVGVAALIVLAGLQFRLRDRDPRPGGYDLLELFCLLAVVPAICAVLGLY
ncbi:type VII secretion integral membrane protein EccD [Amycolatopsis sp. GM8]|uniref:type VII secretion integral membrane protein EccD n=1 Tax=Amycolatopsis sp. GM8 TaxID=2896530 RepID=UPI001F0015A0|nr:type VII secretion integral membrane protein EccD [Amycolatopsis sp. GM8]